MTQWSDDDIDALVRSAYEPVEAPRFDELVTRATRPETPTRALPKRRGPTSQRWLVGLSAAAASALVVVIATQGSGGGGSTTEVASRPASTASDGPVASPSNTVRLGVAEGSPTPTADQLDATLKIIESRIAALGIEANAKVSGKEITIAFSRTDDRAAILGPVAAGGDLQFRPVLTGPASRGRPVPPNIATAPADAGTFPMSNDASMVYELGPSRLGSAAVERVTLADDVDPPTVWLTLRAGGDGIDRFNELAAECFDSSPVCPTGSLAIVLDGVVVIVPQIQTPHFERDQIAISGGLTEASARDLVTTLQYGSFPIHLVQH